MKKLTITITRLEYAKLAAIADVLNMTPEEYIEREGIEWMTDAQEGSVAANIATRSYDTLEEAMEAAAKADVLDKEESDWHFYRMPDGRIYSEIGDYRHEEFIGKGFVLIEEGAAA